mgnify:CR=1 FL=1
MINCCANHYRYRLQTYKMHQTFNITFGNTKKINSLLKILKAEFPKVKVKYKNWDKFKKFTVVRNPWDKLWSGYKYTKWGRLEESIKPYISFKTGIFTQNDEVLYEQWKKSGLAVISGFESNNKLGKTFKEYVNTLYKTYSKKGFIEPLFISHSLISSTYSFTKFLYSSFGAITITL